jgi:predicted aspartyl protease
VAKARPPLDLSILKRDGYGVVPIRQPQPNSLIVNGNINGHDANLVLDSGWGIPGISLDSSYATSLNLPMQGVAGRSTSVTGAQTAFKKGTAGSVVLGNVQLKGVPLFVGMIGALRKEHAFAASGFVGANFLHANSAIVDLENLRLYLRPPGIGRRVQLGPALKAVGLSEAPITWNGGHIFVDAEINGLTGKMIIDTGAYLTLVDTRFASQMKDTGYASAYSMTDAAGVTSQMRMTNPRSFKIGGVAMDPPRVTLSAGSFYSASGGKVIGLLGTDFLGQNWGIIDFGQQKLYFARAK